MNDILLVVQMITFMEQNLTETLTTDQLADKSGYSVNRFRQKFFNVTGDTPSGYLRKRRLTEAAKEILSGKRSLDISLDYGYSSQENFITAFRGYFGITPAELCKMDVKFKRFFSKFREVLNIMELTDLKQAPLHSTDMGCIKGTSDYFDNDLSTAMLYGLSGYGYMINIHKELCPSGPYVWNRKQFYSLLTEYGMAFQKDYRLTKDSTPKERELVESELRSFLNNGCLCVLGYLESQLISGYDEDGFITLLPWGEGCTDSTINRLTFGSWKECPYQVDPQHDEAIDCQTRAQLVEEERARVPASDRGCAT
jgi:AraC-like DNA-binding protein